MTIKQSAPAVIVFVTDEGYSLPTVVAARYARLHAALKLADIVIVSHSLRAQGRALIDHAVSNGGVQHIQLKGRPWEDIDLSQYHQTHVPPSALARFFLPESLTRAYQRVLYFDGDVIPLVDLCPLLDLPLDFGAVGAAEDRAFFYAQELGPTGDRTRAYLRRLGIHARDGYFNSGVLLARADTWEAISRDAFRFFKLNSADCLYHDQSALNVVASAQRIRLSPRWNFQTEFLDWASPDVLRPAVAHFAGGSKPWKVVSRTLQEFSGLYAESIMDLNTRNIVGISPIPLPLWLHAEDAGPKGLGSRMLSNIRRGRRVAELMRIDEISVI